MFIIKKRFNLFVYPAGDRRESSLLHQASGRGNVWQRHCDVSVDGFKGVACIDLNGLWRQAIAQSGTRFEGQVTAYETFVKVGNAMQIKTTCDVI